MPSPLRVAEITDTQVRRARPLLGTVVEIGVTGCGGEDSLHAAVDSAFAAVGHVHSLMSYHDPDSELSRLNREAAGVKQKVHPHTYRVLAAALRMAALSDGAFDPVVASRLEDWGYLPACGAPADPSATWRDIELSDGDCVRYWRPLRLDLGGIAKGYAVDVAIDALRACGVADCIVNAGGDVRAAGPAQPIDLRHPADPSRLAHRVTLQNQALATSAAYFSRKDLRGKRVSALVDARTHEPCLDGSSFSVMARDCMSADALTKVLIFATGSIAERALTEHGATALVLTQ